MHFKIFTKKESKGRTLDVTIETRSTEKIEYRTSHCFNFSSTPFDCESRFALKQRMSLCEPPQRPQRFGRDIFNKRQEKGDEIKEDAASIDRS